MDAQNHDAEGAGNDGKPKPDPVEPTATEKEAGGASKDAEPLTSDPIEPTEVEKEGGVVGAVGTAGPITESSSKTAATTPSHTSRSRDPASGMWGETGPGDPVRESVAMADYEEMQRELLQLHKTQSRKSEKSESRRPSAKDRVLSKKSSKSLRPKRTATRKTEDFDVEDAASSETAGDDDFNVDEFLTSGNFEARRADGAAAKRVGVIFKDLTVTGMRSGSRKVKTLPEAVIGTFGPDLYRIVCYFIPALAFVNPSQTRELIRDFTGVVRDGEMMLVLGRPGSGCSTFLKSIANDRGSYLDVKGSVAYGGIPAAEQARHYRGEVIYNEEDDSHLPQLTVWQTLQFALWNKTKRRLRQQVDIIADALLRMFAMAHTKQTPVGNEYTPGVSGGERKRVSIIETLATKSTVTCWDNSTRGLDASTALDYAKSLRIMTDVSRRTTLVTLYQAGQEIYELMDKVLVIEGSRMIFQGSAREARQYFIDLGFHAPERMTTADFLTSVGDPNERQFRAGFEDSCPKTPAELEAVFRKSAHYQRVLEDVKAYEGHWASTENADAKAFQTTVRESKSHRTVGARSNYTVSFPRQVLACTRREFWLLWGDKASLQTKAFIIVANALIVGSLFYGQPRTTAGAFSRGGTVFFSILFLGWLQLSELMKAVTGRAVVARQRDYAFYRPSAVNLARIITDFPVLLIEVIVFGIIMYFITDLALDPGKVSGLPPLAIPLLIQIKQFFIYLLFIYTTTINITALYRMLASLSPTINDAVRFSGVTLNLLIVFTGYVIPKPTLLSQKIWFGWFYYINPLSYAFEGVLTNEFGGVTMPCAENQLVPQGPGVDPRYQGCAISGAQIGSPNVSGDDYMSSQYSYYRINLWRNWGVVILFTLLYILVTMLATEKLSLAGGGGGATVFKKLKPAQKSADAAVPESESEKSQDAATKIATKGEAAPEKTKTNELTKTTTTKTTKSTKSATARRAKTQDEALKELEHSDSVFTWSDLSLEVPTPFGPKKLLNGINGFAKPGVMVALMGASGAGKTTLLNTLSHRMPFGVQTGNILVDGQKPGIEFQRNTGFVEQNYIHEETASVREALEFSALLRQNRATPRHEKLEYVDQIIDLLELRDLEEAIIMSLSIEQKKRVTIGAELAAKPSLLLFLDEPTSGLDSQSAFSIVRFLKKLTAAGQAIVCTIHQPSSMLIQQFDMILALNPGGNVFYFGDVGPSGSEVVKYFADRGAPCPPAKNIAEFILETAAKTRRRPDGSKLDWNREWRESPENAAMVKQIEDLDRERREAPRDAPESEYEYAAPVWQQTLLLTQRMFRQHWRDPSYLYGKLFIAVVVGIFNGFTFWKLGNTVLDMTNRMFTSFLIMMISPGTFLLIFLLPLRPTCNPTYR